MFVFLTKQTDMLVWRFWLLEGEKLYNKKNDEQCFFYAFQ